MRLINYLFLILSLIYITSCSQYNKILKSDDYVKKFEIANNLFDSNDKKNYERAILLYEQVYQRFPKQSQGEVSYFRIGKLYYLGKDYQMGGYFLGQFVLRFPYSVNVEEATFLSAMCSVKQSPEKSLDQTDTELAINNLQQFIDRFSNSDLIDTCNQIMDKLRFKLESKQFDAVKLYSKTLNYRAAVTAAEIFISDNPASIYKEDVEYILINNSYLLTKNSIESKKYERTAQTLERYRIFAAEFPDSKYLKSLKSIKDIMSKDLESYEKLETKM
jgi:outer membrane protein assembly factor BamD